MENKQRLIDICDLVAGFAFKSKDFGGYSNKVVKIADIQPPVVNTNELVGVDLSNYDTVKLSKYLVSKGDYVLAMTGATIGKLGRLTDDVEAYINQRVLTFRPIESIVDKDYLYYQLCSDKFNKYILNHIDSETAQPNISAGSVGGFEVSLPSLEEQRRIAGILGAIDDKIENNRRINTNLELQAQALYKQWFVDNRCDDWEIKSLSDLMDYQGGSQPPASEFIDKPQDGYVRFVQIRDYASNSHPTYIPIAKKNKLCNKKDIMIARYGASLGRICFGLEGAYNVALAKVKPLENYYREFLRCYLSSNEFYDGINMKGNRAVQAGFNQSDINSFMISCPKQDIFVAFENIVSKILDKRLVLQQENETLATLRDTLLPKLMNGEIKL